MRHARDAPWDRGSSQKREASTGFLWTTEHGFHRASESARPPWRGSSRETDLGHCSAVPTAVSPSGVVACVLSICTPPCLAAGQARAAARTRWQASGAALSATNSGDGSRENYPTMDGARSALLPLATGFRLRGIQARGGCRVMSRGVWEMYQQKHSIGASLQDQGACLDCPQTKNSLK